MIYILNNKIYKKNPMDLNKMKFHIDFNIHFDYF